MARRLGVRRVGGRFAQSSEPPERACRDKAFDLLARRLHFRRELEAKLLHRGYGEEEVTTTLEWLEAEGYVDDLETARYFLDVQLGRGPVGRRKLFAELRRRGAEESVIEKVMQERLPEDDPAQVRCAAERWQARGGDDPRSLARHLERKGFPAHLIRAEVDRLRKADL